MENTRQVEEEVKKNYVIVTIWSGVADNYGTLKDM